MDKYEYKIRADEIKELIAHGEYAAAAEIADTIDWRRVKSVMMLCTISDLYKMNRRYEDAKNLLLLAYERRPGGRTICYSLCELCIKTEEFVQAVRYYNEFVEVAPKDPGRYILQYKLCEAQDVNLEERIGILEELKKRDYREKWAYELAYLYHRVGLATRCVEECDELFLWFGEGKYVIKALELKMLHEPLTAEQQYKYDHRFESRTAQMKKAQEPASGIENQVTDATIVAGAVQHTASGVPQGGEPDEMDIQVKTVDVGQYNTINLQAELAEGLREVLGGRPTRDEEITRSILEPMLNHDTETLDLPEIDEVDEEDLEPEKEQMESSEVFFGETGDLGNVGRLEAEGVTEIRVAPEETPVDAATQDTIIYRPVSERDITAVVDEKAAVSAEPEKESDTDTTAETVMNEMRRAGADTAEQQVIVSQPPEPLARVLSQESDGQISLVVPENERIEKQITGQMSIEDILNEWERMKKENEEKRKEDVRLHVLQHTGNMFTEFEEAVRDGLLEKLEQGQQVEGIIDPEAEEIEQPEEPEAVEEVVPVEEPAESEDSVLTEELVEFEETVEAEASEGTEEATEAEAQVETEEIAEAEPPVESEEITEAELPVESEEIAEAETPAASEELAEAEESVAFEEITEAEEPAEQKTAEDDASEDETDFETEELAEIVEDEAAEEIAESEDEAAEFDTDELDGFEVETPEEPTEVETDDEADVLEATEEFAEEPIEDPAEKPDEVERDKAKVRELTREERELYAPFIQSRSAREKLVKAIDNISMAAYTGNLIITGDEGMDTMSLAKNMIREVQMADSNFSGRVAKVTGDGLNNKDPEETLERLKNGALIVQKASGINGETAAALYRTLQRESRGIIIVLEDTKKAMNKFLAANEELAGCFTARVDVEAMSNDSLVSFGRQYAREMEYSVDELGILALHTRIAERQTMDHAVTVLEVKEIVDEAIRHANKKTPKHFFDVLLGKRYDAEDMIILTEKDFS